MRIAEACYLFSPAVGGVEAHVLNIGTNLVRWGHSVDVYTSDFMALNGLERVIRSSEDRSRGHSVVAGMRVFRLPSHAVRKTTAYAQRLRFPGLLKWLLASDYDVVHVHSIASLHFDLAFVAAKLRGTPVVVTGHYSPSDLDRLWSKRRRLGPLSYPTARLVYWRTWMRFALRHVDAVVAIAGSERERMIALLGLDPARVFTIPNGVNPAEFEAVDESSAVAFRSARGYADDPVVLFVGRISRVKGPDILLEAAARLLGQGIRARFLLVGQHEDRELAAALALRAQGPDLAGLVSLEELPRSEILKAFRACDVVVLPSRGEVFGITLAEGMCCGKVVIGADSGGIPELIHDGVDGRLFETGDASDLARVLAETLAILHTPASAAMGEAARVKVTTRFTWESAARSLAEVYETVTRGR